MVFGDDESTQLTSPGEAHSLNSLPLPLQVAEVKQYLLDKIYFKIHEERIRNKYEKGYLPVFNIVVYYMYSFKAKIMHTYLEE